jgi:D-alanine-D-alanine ligase
MNKKTVLMLFGGESSEHDVSVSSARNVHAAIDKEKYDLVLGYIDPRGTWWLIDQLDEQISTEGKQQLYPLLGAKAFVAGHDGERISPDVILPILHGKNGEDGSVQGLAQLLHIPIVGCDVTASSICMDKVATKEIMAANNVDIVPYHVHHTLDPMPSYDELAGKLSSTLFVKPARAGSSVGVSKVTNSEEFERALELAHQHDKTALIEKAMSIREIEVAVLGTPPHHQASMPGEINPGAEFYSYEDKYDQSSTSSVTIPAPLDESMTVKIQELAIRVYELLGCDGLSRVDFFLAEDGTIYLNEINTLPGFTNISMYPKLWQHQGVSYPELITKLIENALD